MTSITGATVDNKKNIIFWIKEFFSLADSAKIVVEENQSPDKRNTTKIAVIQQTRGTNIFIIKKPIVKITSRDIKRLKLLEKINRKKTSSLIGPVFRFLAWWLAFTGLYSMFAVCPFCGQAGCAVGAGSAGVIGGLFALLMQFGKNILDLIKKFMLQFKFNQNKISDGS